MRFDVLASTLYRTIADLAAYLEAADSPEQWGFLDGGNTLEICSELLERCRQDDAWRQIEQQYNELGGCVYCPDSDDYDLALELAE